MNRRRRILATIPGLAASAALAASLLLAVPAAAETPEEKGLRIAREAADYDSGFGDYVVEGEMILRNRQGQESVRVFENRVLEQTGDGDKSLIVFRRPRDIRGTALLTFTHKTGNDDQWLYLPALKRVKRISSSNRSGAFVGSEFAYEDLTSQEVEKYTYKWLREEPCPGEESLVCNVAERYPVDRRSGYTRQIVWLEKETYRPMRVDYFDRRDAPLKTLTFSGYRAYLDRYWRADRMVMVNHQNGKSTEMIWRNYRFRTGLTDRDFNRNSLKRVR